MLNSIRHPQRKHCTARMHARSCVPLQASTRPADRCLILYICHWILDFHTRRDVRRVTRLSLAARGRVAPRANSGNIVTHARRDAITPVPAAAVPQNNPSNGWVAKHGTRMNAEDLLGWRVFKGNGNRAFLGVVEDVRLLHAAGT